MTGQEIFKRASAYIYENPGDAEDSMQFAVEFLNALLIEALPYENSIRAYEGKPELERAPQIASLSDEIDYHQAIVGLAFPFGLVSSLFEEDLDNYRGQMYRNRYLQALFDAQKYSVKPVEDVYNAGDE